ncbi:DapH/DapD/GlmU-related protein [Caldicellulosiruptoraceae bacterium PP1]
MYYLSPNAKVGENTKIGYYSIIEDGVIIGKNCSIGHHVIIKQGTIIEDNVEIADGTIIGKLPQKSANSKTTQIENNLICKISPNVRIGSNSIIYAGATIEEKVFIADLVTIRENVIIGKGTIVGRGVCIENKCKIGENCKLESNAYITAFSDVEDFAFIAPGVITSNDNYVGRDPERVKHFKGVIVKKGGRIGANATILPGKIIEEDTLIAAGSVVTKDTKPRKIYLGNPAKEYKDVPEKQLLENQ